MDAIAIIYFPENIIAAQWAWVLEFLSANNMDVQEDANHHILYMYDEDQADFLLEALRARNIPHRAFNRLYFN